MSSCHCQVDGLSSSQIRAQLGSPPQGGPPVPVKRKLPPRPGGSANSSPPPLPVKSSGTPLDAHFIPHRHPGTEPLPPLPPKSPDPHPLPAARPRQAQVHTHTHSLVGGAWVRGHTGTHTHTHIALWEGPGYEATRVHTHT